MGVRLHPVGLKPVAGTGCRRLDILVPAHYVVGVDEAVGNGALEIWKRLQLDIFPNLQGRLKRLS